MSTAAGSQDLYVGVKGPDGRFDSHRIDELSTSIDEDDPWVSRDEHRIYFARDRVGFPGVSDLVMADRRASRAAQTVRRSGFTRPAMPANIATKPPNTSSFAPMPPRSINFGAVPTIPLWLSN